MGSFSIPFRFDEDELITNIFWTDSKMVSDYEVYGDIISFNTTYRKLNDGRPGLLVGVNNHKKTTVYGAALLYDETAKSFIWLFKTFFISCYVRKEASDHSDR